MSVIHTPPCPHRTETDEQIAVVQYCDIKRIPCVHIPNEGKRGYAYAAKMKRMGLRSGFPDLFIPRACGGLHGLFVEMKAGRNKTTPNQDKWLADLSAAGYCCRVCYGFDEARRAIDEYIREERKGT